MRILFMGTPEIAEACLKDLVKAGLDICGVFTQPDRPKGRGMKLAAPPVKVYAESQGIKVFQPARIRRSYDIIEELAPDLIAVMAYGKILPKWILDYPKYGCVNVHASLLPKYRGAAPIQAAIAAGDTVGGITTMYMAEELDSGDMIFAQEVPITEDDTGGTLHDKYAAIGGKLLVRTIHAIEAGTAPRIPQDHSKATFSPSIKKEDAQIDWTQSSESIRNLIRAYNPWPSAYTELNGTGFKVHSCTLGSNTVTEKPGTVIECGKDSVEVATGSGSLHIIELQAPGKRRMSATEYLCGNTII